MEPIRMTTIETERPHLMELDALCEYEEDLRDTAEDLWKRNVSKALIRQRTKKEMMERIEEKKQERLIAYVRNRRTTSYGLISDGRSDDVSMGTLTHEETKVVLARMRSLFKDDHQVALQISQALDGNPAVCTKMKVYVGQGIDYQRFLASVLTPDWLFLYLSMHFGSEQEVMALLEVYRTADPESAEAKDAIARLKKATKDIEIVKNFLDLFTPLVQTLAEALSLVFPSLEEAKNFVRRALGGDTMAIQKILNVTGVDAEDLEAVLDTVKRCRDYQCAVLCAGLQKHIAERLVSVSLFQNKK
ncbi:unnamed protein product [Dibothriocephalus latus]|uniref:Uncharacterized protein n=1 Tax=Dibothriocephalus latus TaxID=60516 RepID=A0A3P7LUR1_DIBLA|nr:unnamed protein product [Dibothriocephalus latus]